MQNYPSELLARGMLITMNLKLCLSEKIPPHGGIFFGEEKTLSLEEAQWVNVVAH